MHVKVVFATSGAIVPMFHRPKLKARLGSQEGAPRIAKRCMERIVFFGADVVCCPARHFS